MRRRNAVVLVLLVVATLAVLIFLRHRGSDEDIDRSSEHGVVVSQPVKASTWTKIYTVCEGEGREYIHSELWQGGKKLGQMTPMDFADLGPDHQIKVRIVPPSGLEPKNFSRSSDVLVKEGDSFFGELDCKFRAKFSVPGYDGFRVWSVAEQKEVEGCVYGDNSTYNDRSHSTDSGYCQVFLPGPGEYQVTMVNGRDCIRRCATHSQKFIVTQDRPRIYISTASP